MIKDSEIILINENNNMNQNNNLNKLLTMKIILH